MKQTDTQPLFATPWAEQADNSTITTIPQSSTAIGRASMEMGFPKATMTPIAAGGVPPYGEDMNGILNMLSRAAQAAELGILRPFSADYATAINGYPTGATIAHPTIAGHFLICTADNNTNDPSQSMNGWLDPMGGLISGSALGGAPYQNDFAVSNAGVNKATGTPWFYSTAGGGFINLALQSALQQETQRAEAAEALLTPLNAFSAQLSQSGYQKLPGGLIVQWGLVSNTNITAQFPITFPNSCFVVIAGNVNSQGLNVDNSFAYPVNNSQFFIATKSISGWGNITNWPSSWVAFGY